MSSDSDNFCAEQLLKFIDHPDLPLGSECLIQPTFVPKGSHSFRFSMNAPANECLSIADISSSAKRSQRTVSKNLYDLTAAIE